MGHTKSPTNAELNAEVPLPNDLNISPNAITQHRTEIIQQSDDSQPYEHDRIVCEARLYMTQSVEAMLEAGKWLITLKEDEPHGDFVGVVEEQLSLCVRTTRRTMRASLKYLSPKLEPKATTLSFLGKAKLSELVVKDDDDLAGLANDGIVVGLTLDGADHTSVHGLCQALHEAHETDAAQQHALADKDEGIDSLSTRLEKKSRTQPSGPDEEVKKLRAEVIALAAGTESVIAVRLSSAFETLCAYYAENVVDTPRDFMTNLVCQLESIARSLRPIFDLPDEPIGNAALSWLTEPTPQINGLEA